MLDPLEQRITKLLSDNNIDNNQIEMYLDDVFAFNNRKLYEEADDDVILQGFNKWLGESK